MSMVCEQAVRRGGFANVTDSMWLVLAFQTWYVVDGLYNEVCLPNLRKYSFRLRTNTICSPPFLPPWIS